MAEREKLRREVADLSSRAESTLLMWSAQLRERAKPRPDTTPNTAADRLVAEQKLREQLAELESEMELVQREYDGKAATAAFWEERAMVAMRHSDDVTAQEANRMHAWHANSLQELISELTVLRALAKSCREVLGVPQEQTV